jgi:predicted metalloprotease with PDZ domain
VQEALTRSFKNSEPLLFRHRGGTGARERRRADFADDRVHPLRQAVAGARVKSLRLGSFRFDNLPVVVDSTIATGCDAVMGTALLKRFRLTFDRRRQRVFLLAGALMDVPYDYDMTGLTIVRNGRAFGVSSVAYPSIASVAGLEAGDVIMELDGQAVSGMSLVELRRSFRHDGRRRTLTIQRRSNTQVVTLSMPSLQ